MADRFPSIEDLDAGQPGAMDGSADLINNSADTNDFLSRERALLGADADQFSTPTDQRARASVEDDDDDLLGGGGGASHSGGGAGADMGAFESSFPSLDSGNEQMAPGGTITGSAFLPGAPYQTSAPQSFGTSTNFPSSTGDAYSSQEPDVIREWRERRDLAIQHREEVAAERKSGTVKAAQESIDEFYENYNNKKERNIKQTRKEAEDFLANREDTASGGTSWQRIAKLVDLKKGSAQAAGKERFRDMLSSLVKDENAPGAKGY